MTRVTIAVVVFLVAAAALAGAPPIPNDTPMKVALVRGDDGKPEKVAVVVGPELAKADAIDFAIRVYDAADQLLGEFPTSTTRPATAKGPYRIDAKLPQKLAAKADWVDVRVLQFSKGKKNVPGDARPVAGCLAYCAAAGRECDYYCAVNGCVIWEFICPTDPPSCDSYCSCSCYGPPPGAK